MDKFVGSWELMHEKTENAEKFWDHTNLPEASRKLRRENTAIIKYRKDGDDLVTTITHKGKSHIIYDLKIKLGTPLEYVVPDGSKNTAIFEWKGDKFYEKHKSILGDKVREYDVDCYVEGDQLFRIYSNGGVSMTTVLKRI